MTKSRTGTFNLPLRSDQSTLGARKAYRAQWSRDWPHDDDYLRTLAKEVAESLAGEPGVPKCDSLLTAMRESHVFEGEEMPPKMVRITDEAMRAIESAAVNPFEQTGQRMIDGTWLITLTNELMVKIRSVALPGETISDTIIRGLRATTGAKAN